MKTEHSDLWIFFFPSQDLIKTIILYCVKYIFKNSRAKKVILDSQSFCGMEIIQNISEMFWNICIRLFQGRSCWTSFRIHFSSTAPGDVYRPELSPPNAFGASWNQKYNKGSHEFLNPKSRERRKAFHCTPWSDQVTEFATRPLKKHGAGLKFKTTQKVSCVVLHHFQFTILDFFFMFIFMQCINSENCAAEYCSTAEL